MLSKSLIKRITSLKQKKCRQEEESFVVEGAKSVNEFITSSYELEVLYIVNDNFVADCDVEIKNKTTEITTQQLTKLSFLKTPQEVVAVFKIPDAQPIIDRGITLVLDDIRDPGNLGTIIRLCDWFGIQQLVCSPETVDCYNPKVVQATMGSLSRVQVNYQPLVPYLQDEKRRVYGTFLNGTSIYDASVSQDAVLVMGNEARGISPEVAAVIDTSITIPRFGTLSQTESLNVAMATSICLNEFLRPG